MNIKIEIECETIQDFQSHLLKIFEQSIVLNCKKDREHVDGDLDPSEQSYDKSDISSGQLDDDNCYGSHEVTLLEEDSESPATKEATGFDTDRFEE